MWLRNRNILSWEMCSISHVAMCLNCVKQGMRHGGCYGGVGWWKTANVIIRVTYESMVRKLMQTMFTWLEEFNIGQIRLSEDRRLDRLEGKSPHKPCHPDVLKTVPQRQLVNFLNDISNNIVDMYVYIHKQNIFWNLS